MDLNCHIKWTKNDRSSVKGLEKKRYFARFGTICAIYKTVKDTPGGVLHLIKLWASACKFTKSNTLLWFFFTFFELNKWYQITQSVSFWNNGKIGVLWVDLNYFWPMFPFHTPWKHQKTKGFLVFSGDTKWELWPDMG